MSRNKSKNVEIMDDEEVPLVFQKSNVKVRLIGREISIKAVDNSGDLAAPNVGMAFLSENRMAVARNKEILTTVFHELFHFYLHFTGIEQAESINIETACDLAGCFIDQFIMENGTEKINEIMELQNNG